MATLGLRSEVNAEMFFTRGNIRAKKSSFTEILNRLIETIEMNSHTLEFRSEFIWYQRL